VLAGHGFQSVLLLTGEAPKAAPVAYLPRPWLSPGSTSSPWPWRFTPWTRKTTASWWTGSGRGDPLHGTYHRETYGQVHRRGRKRDYGYRLEAIARAGRGGVRKISLGALLGLYHWWADGFWLGLHARQLQKECWQSAVSLSFPRLRHAPERFRVEHLPTTGSWCS